MISKLTAKNLLNYIRTTREKYNFRANKTTQCPIACYLKSLGYQAAVYRDRLYYKSNRSPKYWLDPVPRLPNWIPEFVIAYDEAKPKHRLATAAKVLERVVAKQVKRRK